MSNPSTGSPPEVAHPESAETDANGDVWDAEYHTSPPTKTQKGAWKKKRRGKKQQVKQEPEENEEASESVMDEDEPEVISRAPGRPAGSANADAKIVRVMPGRCYNQSCLSTELVPSNNRNVNYRFFSGETEDGPYNLIVYRQRKCAACGQIGQFRYYENYTEETIEALRKKAGRDFVVNVDEKELRGAI